MTRELRDVEISEYINEFIYIYELYKANGKNYELTLEQISNIDNMRKDNLHMILLKIIDIDNFKDEKLNQIVKKNNLAIPFDNYNYSNKIIKIYKELYDNRITYEIFNEVMKSSIIIFIKSGQISQKYLIKFKEVHLSSTDLVRIMDDDYTNETCLICLENINDYPSFRIFNCCFSKTCSTCFKNNDFKCPICNIKSPTLISY